MKRVGIQLFILQALLAPLSAQVSPVGDEFAVNVGTTNWQWDSQAASASDGSFVVVWTDGYYNAPGQDGSVSGIQARRFDKDGAPVGNEFQVNSTTLGLQYRPAIAMNDAGEFVVVWAHYYYTQNEASIMGQRFDATASPVGEEFQVSTFEPSTGYPTNPDVAMAPGSPFVVVWQVTGPEPAGDTASWHVRGRVFDANGDPLTADMRVNTYTTGSQCCAVVGMAADGTFTVVYEDGYYDYAGLSRDGSATGQFGQRFAANGSFLGADFQVHTYTTGDQFAPDLAMDPSGNFIVTWTDYGLIGPAFDGQDGSGAGVFAQRFDSNANRIGDEFQVNSNTLYGQLLSTVEHTGSFVVAWQSYSSEGGDNSSSSVQARLFDDQGAAQGADFQVNSYVTGYQYSPTIGSPKDGTFVVAWSDRGQYPPYNGQDGSLSGIQAQRYSGPIFVDGFESGDASAWSGTQ